MILKTDQLLKFSQFCKENELFFSSDRLSDLIIFLKKNELDNMKRFAVKNNLKIVTTEKDYFRINKELRQDLDYIEMDLEIVNEKQFLDLLS